MFHRPTAAEDAAFAVDAAVLGEADLVRVRRRLDELGRRIADLESRPAVRLERRLRSLGAGRGGALMRIAMTLVVRDEADIVGTWLDYHLASDVSLVIATDHRSVDGTSEILREHERDGRVVLLREEGDVLRQAEWVTRMSRLAATEHGADWVIPSDADEFWWPRGGSSQWRSRRYRPGSVSFAA